MNSPLQRTNLKRSALAYIAAASVLPALAQSAPLAGAGAEPARGNNPTNEAVPGTSGTAGSTSTATQSQSANGFSVPPIPAADANPSAANSGNAANAAIPSQNAGAVQTLDAQKNTDIKSATAATASTTAAAAPGTNTSTTGETAQATATAIDPTAATTDKSQGAAPLQATDTTILVPNGAALQTQLLPLNGTDSSPWTSYAAGAFLILGLAAAGVMAVRLRQGKTFGLNRSEKQMQLISTLALSPKRQILLIRIRDKEVAVASTEHGMTVLTEMQAHSKTLNQSTDDSGGEEPRRRKVQQRITQDEPVKLVASEAESLGEETAVARSEMLMGALKNLREKNLRGRTGSNTSESPVTTKAVAAETASREKKILDSVSDSKGRGEPTLKQTRAAFPKYLANAFEQESKRSIPQSTASNNNSSGADDASNVTNMIRERLKDLRPLA